MQLKVSFSWELLFMWLALRISKYGLKHGNEKTPQKIFQLISSVLVWSNTPPKEKKEDEEEQDGGDGEEGEEAEEVTEESEPDEEDLEEDA